MAEPMRLQKAIAQMGICSRRKAESFISAGEVKVDGVVVTELGTKVDPEAVHIEVGSPHASTASAPQIERGATSEKKVYIALNKPVGYICSASSEQGATVLDLLTEENQIGKIKTPLKARVYPVGRLDKDSEGLVLLTNDGDLTNKLTHPRYEHKKVYEVTIDSPLTRDATKVLEHGMVIGEDHLKGIKVKDNKNLGKKTVVTVVLTEGKNRQIRKMFGQLGYHVIALKRTNISSLQLGVLSVGRWKYVKKHQIIRYN